jgi:hypothetical protein
MSKPLRNSLRQIIEAAAAPRGNVVPIEPPAREPASARPTLKERARQLSVYLEPAVYDQLRDIAYVERTKIHPLMLEALDLLFKQRGARARRARPALRLAGVTQVGEAALRRLRPAEPPASKRQRDVRMTCSSRSRTFLRSVFRLTPRSSAARIWLPRVAASAAPISGPSISRRTR